MSLPVWYGEVCHYCGLPITNDSVPIQAKTKNAWAHFTCWYDGGPFERERRDLEAAERRAHEIEA